MSVPSAIFLERQVMLLTENQPENDVRQAGIARRFALCVKVTGGNYLVDLPRGRFTIGYSPRCNIRLEQSGIHPLQCLVVHDVEGLTLRRWATDTLLNGSPFDEAHLSVGDHISVGPVDLEVVLAQEQLAHEDGDLAS